MVGGGIMEYITLLKANIKRHNGMLIGIFVLVFIVTVTLSAVLTVWSNSGEYVLSEIRRTGFGNLTAWVSDVPDISELKNDISDLRDVKEVKVQNIIYSDYVINGEKSDSQGQLFTLNSKVTEYKFFKSDLSGYSDTPNIVSGEVYVSPSVISIYNAKIGDKINFSVARGGKDTVLTIAGYYEDPVMGSSMIGMKGFIVSYKDYNEMINIIESSDIDALANRGAMLHIFKEDYCNITASELNRIINDNTKLSEYVKFIYSESTICGFMILLQNVFCGFFAAFVIVLFFVSVAVLGHSISSNIDTDFVNIGILKTLGFTSKKLRQIQLIQYLSAIISGEILGLIVSVPIGKFVIDMMLTTTGVLLSANIPIYLCLLGFIVIFLLFIVFILCKTTKIGCVTPIKAIVYKESFSENCIDKPIFISDKHLKISLAFRQVVMAKHRYIGVCAVAVLLVFFASLAGRINSWLGYDGKGLMDAFNPADHHIGIQFFGNHDISEAESIVLSYTGIKESYLLAMPRVAVNGIDYTANVISKPESFHILRGRTCKADNEIVITEFVANDLGINIGDTLIVKGEKDSNEYIVSGIYQCANDMGSNIGMSREGYLKIGNDKAQMWCHHYFIFDTSKKQDIIEELETVYGGDIYVHKNSWSGLFGIINAMNILITFIYLISFMIIFIVTSMTADKMLFFEQKDLGIFKAIGFSVSQLRITFAVRFGMVAFIGSIIGVLLAEFFTDPIISRIMRLEGISNFVSNPTVGSALLPMAVVVTSFTVFAYLYAGKIKNVNLNMLINE
jgi:hypothetical protein